MYCGGELPAAEDAAVEEAVAPDRARELLAGLSEQARAMMPPEVLARLRAAADSAPAEPEAPPVVRSRLGFTGLGRRGTTSASLPAVAGPTPPSPVNISSSGQWPAATEDDSIEPLPTDRLSILDEPSADADLPEDPPALARLRPFEDESLDPIATAAIRPLDTGEMEALPFDAVSSFYELEAIPDPYAAAIEGPLTEALRKGGGPFGPRDSAFRLILLPEEDYRSKLHWLRHRLADTTGVDLYTAAQTLSKEVPSFLIACTEEADAEERAEHLRQGGLRVLVLRGSGRTVDIEPIPVVEASGEGPGPVTFQTADGGTIEVKRSGFTWACLGEIEPDADRGALVRDRSGRGRGTHEGRRFDVPSGPYLLLDLYLSLATQPIRIRSDRFDFACLGPARELAATLNMRKLTGWLAADPAAPIPLDERFKRLPRLHVAAHRGDGDGSHPLPQREVEFTEYGLIVNAQHRGATTV
jgi:hypothetical protein